MIITAKIKIQDKIIRIFNVHNNVSSWATETEQMFETAQIIVSKMKFSKKYPTILSGDFNIQKNSYSIQLLKTVCNYHCKQFSNTLSKDHRALINDFPEGLAVDHVFSKDLEQISTDTFQINFSDHQAVVSEFEI